MSEQKLKIIGSENVKVTYDEENDEYIISAPTMNHTNIKCDSFKVGGDAVEFIAGRNITLKTAMPNKVIISVDLSKHTVELIELRKRFQALETVVMAYVKKE